MSKIFPLTKKLRIATVCCVISCSALADSYDDGLLAFAQGDYHTAEQHFQSAAAAGDSGAQHMLMRLYREGKGAQPNAQQAFHWNLQAAQNGVVQARFELAERYFQGDGTSRDLKQAFRWYQSAARQGHHMAIEKLAYFYETGQVVKRDPEHAQHLYNVAASEYDVFAQKGDPIAQNALAGMYETARGVEMDLALALTWYKKAALQEYAQAQYNTGRLLLEESSSEQNIAEAAYWLDLAAAQGLHEAKELLVQIEKEHGTNIAMR
ncbi:tetratricopeptide repeat protein [Kaarinaea lacus]